MTLARQSCGPKLGYLYIFFVSVSECHLPNMSWQPLALRFPYAPLLSDPAAGLPCPQPGAPQSCPSREQSLTSQTRKAAPLPASSCSET